MTASLTPQQTLVVWYLIGHGGQAWQKDIKPGLKPADRTALIQAGLIAVDKRRDDVTRRQAQWIEVTDAGWAWANNHLDAELPVKTQAAGPILQVWLTQLQKFMKRRGIALAEIVGDSDPAPDATGTPGPRLEERIRRAYLDASGGAWNQRVRLADLRRALNGIERGALDRTLLEMQRRQRLVLYRLDNRREITAADEEAAIAIGSERVHILYMGRP